jgi:hypothetical protein
MNNLLLSLRDITRQNIATIAGISLLMFAHSALSQAIISPAAGNGVGGFKGGSISLPGPSAELFEPHGLALDAAGNLYVADTLNGAVRKLDTNGLMTTIAGNGDVSANSCDGGGLAINASLMNPTGVAVALNGDIYIADAEADLICRIDFGTGNISRFAGDGQSRFSGDNGPATDASFDRPLDIAIDSVGNLYIADRDNQRIRRVDTAGVITTVAGNTGNGGYDPTDEGNAAVDAQLNNPQAIAVDAGDNLYIVDSASHIIRVVDSGTGNISTIAGTPGTSSDTGDGGLATAATLRQPRGIFVDGAGNIYFGDTGNERIRRIDAGTGIITGVSGTGTQGFGDNYIDPTLSDQNMPWDVVIDVAGTIFISELGNHRVRKIALATGNIVPTDVRVNPDTHITTGGQRERVGTLSAVDGDPGDSHYFTVAGGTGATDNPVFTISTGGSTSLRIRNATGLSGPYTVGIQADDYNGGVFAKMLTITVTDGVIPVIALTGDNPQLIEAGSAYAELGASATDDVDGDISASLVIDATAVNALVPGDYSVTYDVSDLTGNAAATVTRTVTVAADATPPVITLTGANPQTIQVGSAYVELGATATDAVDDDATLTAAIVIDASAVNTGAAGNYTVTYDVTDAAGNAAVTVSRTVTVEAAVQPPQPPPQPSSGGCTIGPSDGTVDPTLPLLMLISLTFLLRRRKIEI